MGGTSRSISCPAAEVNWGLWGKQQGPLALAPWQPGLEVRGATREVNWGLVLLLAGSSPSCGVPPLCRGQAPHTESPLNLLSWANYFLTVKLYLQSHLQFLKVQL